MPYAAALDAKEARIRTALRRVLGPDASVLDPPLFTRDASAGPPLHFRQKVSFVFGTGPGGRLLMGHFARETQRVVPVEECPVHSARGNRIAFALRERLAGAAVGAADGGRSGSLRHLLVRTSADDRDAVAMLVVTRNDKVLRAPVRAWLASPDAPDGFFVNIHTAPGPFMVGPVTQHIAGRTHVRERIGDLVYLIAPTAFFQTNVVAARHLQALVVEQAGGFGPVLDLYCGSGLLSLPLARSGATVHGVEENAQAVADAEANRRYNQIPARLVRFSAARVEDALDRVRTAPGMVILDPPRQGCAPRVLAGVFGRLEPRRAVYVSCSLDALVLEIPAILASGYRARLVRAVDMFPWTDHLETVVVFDRVAPRRQ